MPNKDSPFKGLTIRAKITAVYEDYVVTLALHPVTGEKVSITFSWNKWAIDAPRPKSGQIVLLGKIHLLVDKGLRAYEAHP